MTKDILLDKGKENFLKLKELYLNKATVVPFVGAGPSIPIGIAGWDSLLKTMIKDFTLEISEFRELFSSNQLSKVASKIYSKINAEDYRNYLSSKLKGTSANYIDIHIKTIQLFNTIVTTNFDCAFDDAASDLDREFSRQIMPIFNVLDIMLNNTIIYLHGHIETGDLIFRDEDYSIFYDEHNSDGYASDLYDLVKVLVKETHIVFIGFSFQDKYFTKLFNRIINKDLIDSAKSIEKHFGREEYKQKKHFSFMLLPTNENEAIQIYELLSKMNILPIFYEGSHSEIGTYLKLIKETQVKDEIGLEVLDV